ncbi:hypothetical protein [Sphingobacterium daejeonense]|uniref:hypothetical protein n=1 Tax=Sphingobacterium daejeonense TaxID=371142 RepID=UPI001E2E7E4C|nr:hypothetical protein [Sphingobacterium daejeonense]
MNNIEMVCNHLKEKLAHLGDKEVQKRTMTLYKRTMIKTIIKMIVVTIGVYFI